MNFRCAHPNDTPMIDACVADQGERTRLKEIIAAALAAPNAEYRVAVAVDHAKIEIIAAYGVVAGTIGTAALHGLVPVTKAATELLSFAAHDLQKLGAKRIVAEFPDTDEFKPYRDVLLESGYDPTGLVEDFYRDGIAMVILTRTLTS